MVAHFRPTKTHVSEKYGRHFFIDIGMHFVSAPSLDPVTMDMMKHS